jgi:COPI associated protein
MTVDNSPLHSAFFSQEAANEAGSVAGNFAKEQVDEVKRLTSEGDLSIRLLAMIGGLAMVVVSILGFIARILTFHWLNALLSIYTFILGLIMLLLEGKAIPFSKAWEETIVKYALFLKFVWGRGCLYFVAGTLTISGGGLIEALVGLVVALVGLAFIIIGRRSAKKLEELKKSQFSETTIKAEFDAASGSLSYLNVSQFQNLVHSLNVDFNRREAETAFMQIEKKDKEKLTFTEFKNWWNDLDHQASSF